MHVPQLEVIGAQSAQFAARGREKKQNVVYAISNHQADEHKTCTCFRARFGVYFSDKNMWRGLGLGEYVRARVVDALGGAAGHMSPQKIKDHLLMFRSCTPTVRQLTQPAAPRAQQLNRTLQPTYLSSRCKGSAFLRYRRSAANGDNPVSDLFCVGRVRLPSANLPDL